MQFNTKGMLRGVLRSDGVAKIGIFQEDVDVSLH